MEEVLRGVQTLEAENRRLAAEVARLGGSRSGASVGVGPIFIGGTGRSGTWMLGRLLARHPDLVAVHTELRVHASHRGGFRRVLDGSETAREFADFARDHWFTIKGPNGNAKGLALVATMTELNAASNRLVQRAEYDVPAALGGFLRELVDPYALGRGARTWIETTPDNAAAADCITAALPEARVINIVRDGRDAAVSATGMPWGPNRPASALRWWAKRVRAADAAMSAAPSERVLTIRFEEFVITHREQRFAELLEFLGLEPVRPMVKYFEQRVSAESANVGRWRAHHRLGNESRIDHRYRRIYARLAAEGVSTLPVDPDTADLLAG